MRRRALLAALAATGAGCLRGLSSSDAGPTFRVSDLAASSTKVAPEKRYVVEVTAVASEAALADDPADYTVVALRNVEDPAVREVLEAVIRDDELRRDEVPDGLRELTERVDYFSWGAENRSADATSHWAVAVRRQYPDRDPVVQFDAAVVDGQVAPDDPGVLAFSLANVGERPQAANAGAVPPFGILRAEGPDGRLLLWHDYDEATDCVTVGPDGTATASCSKSTVVDPGETVTREYDLRHSPPVGGAVTAGEYVVADQLPYGPVGDGGEVRLTSRLELEVAFSVERA